MSQATEDLTNVVPRNLLQKKKKRIYPTFTTILWVECKQEPNIKKHTDLNTEAPST